MKLKERPLSIPLHKNCIPCCNESRRLCTKYLLSRHYYYVTKPMSTSTTSNCTIGSADSYLRCESGWTANYHVNLNHKIRGVMHFLQQSGRQMDLYQDPSFQEFRTVLDSKMKGLKVLAWGLRLSHLLNRKKSSCGRKESLEKALHRRCPMQYFSAMASTLSILPNHGRGKVWRATISPICRRCFKEQPRRIERKENQPKNSRSTRQPKNPQRCPVRVFYLCRAVAACR